MIVDIDPYLNTLDSNRIIQEKLKTLAEDVFNNNESLTVMRPAENDYFSELIDLIEPIIKQNKLIFLNKNTQSFSSRLNYSQIYNLSKSENEDIFIYDIALWLSIFLTNEKQKDNEDYAYQLLESTSSLPPEVDLVVSKDGLVNLTELQGQVKLLDHAIDLHDGRRIYLHQFLRRHFNSNFADIPRILNFAMQYGLKVEVRMDPFRIGSMLRYRNIMECDAWHGPKFSQQLLESKDKTEKTTIHHFNGKNLREKVYNQYVTIFRTSMLDSNKGLRQFFVEEYPPFLDRT